MAAAAFTETIIFKGRNGATIQYPLTVSDVVAAYALTPDGSDFLQLPSDQQYMLIDIIVVTGGTDTNNQDVFVNGTATSLKINNKSNLTTTIARQFQQAPQLFNAGAKIKLKQSA